MDRAGREFKALTGLRALAALWVVSLHYDSDISLCFPAWRHLHFLTAKGHLGVDIFFVLSGFVLAHVYHPFTAPLAMAGWRRFILYRLARIYPAHLTTTLVLIAMVFTARKIGVHMEGNYQSSWLLPNLILVHAWPPWDWSSTGAGWNYPSWSVSAEWFAYLFVFPLLYFLRRATRPVPSWVGGYLAIGILWLAWRWISWPTAWLMVSLEFIAGTYFYQTFLELPSCAAGWLRRFLPIFLAVLLLAVFLADDHTGRTLIYFSIPLIIIGLACEKNHAAGFLSTALLHWLGTISYSIYLTHAVVQKLFVYLERYWLIGQQDLAIRTLFALGMASTLIAASAALYYGVESPARKLIRHWS